MKLKITKLVGLIFVMMLLIVSGCKIVTVDQVTTATTGEKITVYVQAQIIYDDTNPHYGLLGLLTPKDWAVDSVKYEGDVGSGYLYFLHPDSADAEPGVQDYWADSLEVYFPSGDDMHWVVYQSDTSYTVKANDYIDIYIDFTVGKKPGDYNLSYFISNAANEIKLGTDFYDISEDHPITVVGKEFVDVTFIANTATVPDTLGPNSVVQIRGAGGPLTWDGNSPTRMTNIGGDYWQVTLQFKPDEDVQFKFYTNANTTIAGGVEWEHQGWEGDVATSNRQLKVGAADTTLPLQFVNGWKSGAGQYEPPFTTTDSTTTVWVRVNMQGWDDFNAASQQIGIRGSNQVDWGQTGELSWGKTHLLNPESDHPNGGSQQYSGRFFYSNAVHVPNKYIGSNIQFKVVVHNAGAPLDEDWGNMIYNSGREDVVAVNVDTTAYWFWFDNKRPTVVDHKDVVIVEFVADMKNAIDGKGFAFGDTLEVRSGYYGTATGVTSKIMRRQGFTTRYSAIDTVTTTIGAHLDYQYYKIKNGIEYREIYYNFLYTGLTAGEAERRVVDPIAGATIKVEDILDCKSQVHRMPLFRNTAVLARDVLVTFECDARPAIYQVKVGTVLDDIQGNLDISDPNQVLQLGVAMNGPATGGWGTWGAGLMTDTLRQMFDDGTHGDRVAGDSIYTIQIQYKGGVDVIGQEFKFGIGGGDNEGGYGNNHIENIDDTNPTFTLSAQFGSIDPVSYYTWNFNTRTPTSVKETVLSTLPTEFSLDQNYPNPFNPTTQIMYSLPRETAVTLSVYNTRGQKVATLVSKKQAAGVHQVSWTAQDDNGVNLPTGLYFYRLEAGEFSTTKKMLLVK